MASSETVSAEQYIDLKEQNRDLLHVIAVLVKRTGGTAMITAAELTDNQMVIGTHYDVDSNLTITVFNTMTDALHHTTLIEDTQDKD
jgi:hypothetical protein